MLEWIPNRVQLCRRKNSTQYCFQLECVYIGPMLHSCRSQLPSRSISIFHIQQFGGLEPNRQYFIAELSDKRTCYIRTFIQICSRRHVCVSLCSDTTCVRDVIFFPESHLNTDTRIIRTPWHIPLVSVLTCFNRFPLYTPSRHDFTLN